MPNELCLIAIPSPETYKELELELQQIQKVLRTSDVGQIFPFSMPVFSVGTLDTLMGLSDEVVKLNTAVEGVLRKLERQYYDTAGASADKMKVNGSSPLAYLKNFNWDVARFRYSSLPINDIISQMSVLVTGIDEEAKRLGISVGEKQQELAAAQRRKVINLATSDFEDFLTPKELTKIDIENNKSDEEESSIFVTVLVAIPSNLEETFLSNYNKLGNDIAAFGGPNWLEDKGSLGKADGNYGPYSSRSRIKGSPVLPIKPEKIYSTPDSILYSMKIIKGHYEAGTLQNDGTFQEGNFVDYITPLTIAAREKRYIIRRFEFDENKIGNGGVDAQIESSKKSLEAIEARSIQWAQSNFGELYSAWVHLKIIRGFVESVLKYGLTYGKQAKFESFFYEASKGKEKKCEAKLNDFFSKNSRTSKLLDLSLQDDSLIEEGEEETTSFVMHKFTVI